MNEIPLGGGGIKSINDLFDSELVRSEFLSPTFQAKVTVQYTSLTFNAASVRLFSDTRFVQVLIDQKKKRMFVIPCLEHTPCSLKWSNEKNGKKQSRNCLARITCAKLFEMMKWVPENRYKIMAVYQEIDNYRIVVFNLNESEMLVNETIKNDDGTIKKERKVIRPIDWLHTFGNIFRSHAEAYKVDLKKHYLLADNLTGEDSEFIISNSQKTIAPHKPDPIDIMRGQYGGIEQEDE